MSVVPGTEAVSRCAPTRMGRITVPAIMGLASKQTDMLVNVSQHLLFLYEDLFKSLIC